MKITQSRVLWTIALLAMAGDVVTTVLGIRAGYHEQNPLLLPLMEYSVIGTMVATKLFVLALGVSVWYWLPEDKKYAIPVALALPTGIATIWNSALIFL